MLEIGDIILYLVVPSSGWLDRAIGAVEFFLGMNMRGQQYCHCAIYAGKGMTYEARWPKTGLYQMDKKHPYEAWRINGITTSQINKMTEWAEENKGQWYDVPALLTAGLIQMKHSEVCSTFVADCLRWAKLTDHVGFTTPDQIQDIIKMTKVKENY